MRIKTESYLDAKANWPDSGEHVLAQYDDEKIVVYQAYNPAIAGWAVDHQEFGGPWSFGRMSWIKPNFLWMMFRCGWATKENQERVLAIHLAREGFAAILDDAVATSFGASKFETENEWRKAMAVSEVRLQWDPDHDPTGAKVERRAIQLGMKGEILRRFATEWALEIEDITDFVLEQREFATPDKWDQLVVPRERPFGH